MKASTTRTRSRVPAGGILQRVARLVQEQPIVMAALSAALGAAIGAAFPALSQEKKALAAVGSDALTAGRSALAHAAAAPCHEAMDAELNGKVVSIADKVVASAASVAPKV